MPLDPQFRTALDTFETKGLSPLVRGDIATTRAHYQRLALSRRGADYVPTPPSRGSWTDSASSCTAEGPSQRRRHPSR